MKTSIIKHVGIPNFWAKGEIYFFDIELEGEELTCNIGAKEENPDWLQVGKELKYETGEIKELRGQQTMKVKRVNPQAQAFRGGGGKFNPQAEKCKMITMCLSYAKDLTVDGKIRSEQMITTANKFIDFCWEKVDEL